MYKVLKVYKALLVQTDKTEHKALPVHKVLLVHKALKVLPAQEVVTIKI